MSKAKTYIIIGIAILIVVLAVWGVLRFSSLGTKIDEKIAEKKLGASLDAEIASAGTPTMTTNQIKLAADKLYTAMKGWGTDEDAIYEVFTGITTRADILALIKYFGVKGGANLVEWITAELSSSEREKLNSIIAGNGVMYMF